MEGMSTSNIGMLTHKDLDTATVLSSNIRRMSMDRNVLTRTLTISIVGPTAVAMVLGGKYTTTILIWFFLFSGLLEWSAVKRHIKVALLMTGVDECPGKTPKEYATPVPPPNGVIIIKSILSSLVACAACIGAEAFLVYMTLYFIGWTILTLSGQNGLETKARLANKIINAAKSYLPCDDSHSNIDENENSTLRQNFLYTELRMVAEKQPTELLLNFCLEYFGFVWVTGVTYPLLVFDMTGVGLPLVLASLVGNFTVDIVAFLVGRSLKGKTHSLYPRVSPNKSIEGAIAGVFANGLVVAIILYYNCKGGHYIAEHWCTFPVYFLLGIVFGIAGVLGDLLQSLLKRTARVKDSGVLIRGHGGVLDRIDGMLIVFPVMYVCTRILTVLP